MLRLICITGVLLEVPQRRGELALFVSPRALGALLPLDFDRTYEWAERAIFSVSFAILFSAASTARMNRLIGRQDRLRLRGMMGYAITTVMR